MIKHIFLIIAGSLFTTLLFSGTSHAYTFDAGRIIDDSIFTNKSSMTAAQIQDFLNAKVPNCDTNGTKPSEYGGGTRAQWGIANGYAPPYICLKDYKENNKTAAKIIYDTAQEFSINPQVLLVLLQKEQALVLDEWPVSIQYRSATGYGCPDTAACDTTYYGFTNQVTWAARMFRAIMDNSPTWYTPYILGKNYIQYSPNTSCGGSNVIIENRATQALYNYTPYQPNQATLNAGWGTATCGAYGNRNFWLYFTNWFGNTKADMVAIGKLSINSSGYTNENTQASFWVRNITNKTISLGYMSVKATNDSSKVFNFPGVNNITLKPGDTFWYKKSLALPDEGDYNLEVIRKIDGAWKSPPYEDLEVAGTQKATLRLINAPQITKGLALSKDSSGFLYEKKRITATFTVKNTSTKYPVTIGYIKTAVRNSRGESYDFGRDNTITIQPNKEYIYSKSRTLPAVDTYKFWIANYTQKNGWNAEYPKSASKEITRKTEVKLRPALTLTKGLSLNDTTTVSANKNISFTVTNHSDTPQKLSKIKVAVRDPIGKNYDYSSVTNITIQPNSSYTYNKTRSFPAVGLYTSWIAYNSKETGWTTTYPEPHISTARHKGNIRVAKKVEIIQSLTVTPSPVLADTPTTLSVKIRNNTSVNQSIGKIKFAIRDEQKRNLDPKSAETIVLKPNEVLDFKTPYTFTKTGKYTIWLANNNPSDGWNITYPSSTSGVKRIITIDVLSPVVITKGLVVNTKDNSVNATFTITNKGKKPISIGRIKAAVRHQSGSNHDFASSPYITIEPGKTYTYSESIKPSKSGTYNAWIANYRKDIGWSNSYPASSISSIVRSTSFRL